MRKGTMIAAISAALALAALDLASAAHAAGAAGGTKETITFESLVQQRRGKFITKPYDGFDWSNIGVLGLKLVEGRGDGYSAVIDGKVVAFVSSGGSGSEGSLTAVSGTFSMKSGHFAAECNSGLQVVFSGYRKGNLVAQMTISLNPVKTRLAFDSTFRRIDTLVIDGSGGEESVPDCTGEQIGMDDLVVSF